MALVAYPVVIEPWIPNRGQTTGWSAMYVLFAISCAATAYFSLNRKPGAAASEAPPDAEPSADEDVDTGEDEGKRPGAKELINWLSLSAAGSCMLLAISSHITQNIE